MKDRHLMVSTEYLMTVVEMNRMILLISVHSVCSAFMLLCSLYVSCVFLSRFFLVKDVVNSNSGSQLSITCGKNRKK